MEHVRHRNFLNETVEIDGRDFEDCTFTNVKLMTHGKKSSAFHHGTFYGTVALTTDNDALSAFGEAMWSLGMTSYDGVGEDAKKNFWISRRYVGPGRLPEKFPAAPPTEPLQK